MAAAATQSQKTATSGTGANTVLAAGAGKSHRDIAALIITTANTVAGTLTLNDGTSDLAVFNYPNAGAAPSCPLVVTFPHPLHQTKPNKAWTLTASANASGYNVLVQYVDRR